MSTARPPWFADSRPVPAGASVAIIGAGIGGCSVAAALAEAGYRPVLIERHGTVAAESSGNPLGLLKPRLTADSGHHGRFYGAAYLEAWQQLDRLADQGHDVWAGRGVLSVARDAEELALMQKLAPGLPPGEAEVLSAGQAAQRGGVHAPHGGLWFANGGTLRPATVCAALARGFPLVTGAVASMEPVDGGWRLLDAAGAMLCEADAVVVAAGAGLPQVAAHARLPLSPNRGQVSILLAGPDEGAPVGLSFGGYVTAAAPVDGWADGAAVRVLGATYDRLGGAPEDNWRTLRPADDDRNRAVLTDHLPDLERRLSRTIVASRVGLRAAFADYLPVLGPLFDADAFAACYGDLHHGRRAGTYPPAPWQQGAFVLGGLGSRGFQCSTLLARALAAMMSGAPSPLPADLLMALHPARFQVRRLRRRPTPK